MSRKQPNEKPDSIERPDASPPPPAERVGKSIDVEYVGPHIYVSVAKRLLKESDNFLLEHNRRPMYAYLGSAEFISLCEEFGIPLADAGRGLAWAGLIILRVYHVSHLRVS